MPNELSTADARSRWLIYLGGWLALFAVTVIAYLPGLHGPFVLDDFSSIARLGDFGGVRDWETFKAFVFSGTSGPTGRPLSLLSFLVDGSNWPTDPYPFKRTNLVIHLANGVLLGLVIAKLLEALDHDRAAVRGIALLCAGVWLLHPFLVSTTLYPVQRMAQLATLFMLAGILAWMHGRMLVLRDPRRAYLLMSLLLPLFTFLAMISKENGILLPVLVGVIELTVFARQGAGFGSLDRRWTAVFVWLPLGVIAAYLGERFFRPNFLEVMPPRDFSIFERLLTQSRILFDYLQNWVIPKLYTTGVYQDHVIKSTGVLTPATTLASIMAHAVLLVAGFRLRARWPLVSLAILFFYANHILESTVINLELYFEHRNYLAMALLSLPLATALWSRVDRRVFVLLSLAVLAVLGGFTRYSATIWQTPAGIIQASAMKAPTSSRAQSQYALLLVSADRPDEAFRVFDEAIAAIPGENALLRVNKLTVQCELGMLDSTEVEQVSDILSAEVFDARLLKVYHLFAKTVVQGSCPDVSLDSVLPMFTRMLDVPKNAEEMSIEYTHINFLIGYVNLYLGDIEKAMAAFEDSLAARPGASYAMAQAALLATNGYSEQALHLSDVALTQLDTQNNTTLIGQRANEADIREFQATVRAELEAQQGASTVPPIP
jgi:tetratricopeptide (TPR) repeat protein